MDVSVGTQDPLTGLFMRDAIKVSSLYDVIIFIDLDNFKTINNADYNIGDIIIQLFSRLLTRFFRRKNDHVYRYGGDEFVIVLNNCLVEFAELQILKFRKESPLRFSYGVGYTVQDAMSQAFSRKTNQRREKLCGEK